MLIKSFFKVLYKKDEILDITYEAFYALACVYLWNLIPVLLSYGCHGPAMLKSLL